jgi:hypothetical protein
MPIPPLDPFSLSSSISQFKGQALTSLFDRVSPTWSSGPLAGAAGDNSFFNRVGDPLRDTPAHNATFGSILDQFSASLHMTELPTPTTPTGLDAAGSFSTPGQNMVTVLNRVEVTFKAQFSELGEMRKSLVQEQDSARKLNALSGASTDADIKTALDAFVASYNAGVNRFAPAVAKGGVLEGSWEAERARFATGRDINYILNGSEIGLKGGLAALGIGTDPKTGLATIDHAQLDTALAKNKANVVAALTSFAGTFVDTVACLNAADHAQVRQMANLDRAVHWIEDNKAAVQKEFGPGAAATPNDAFAKAAALYDDMERLSKKS